ncbi:hypothetical protein V1515DRAFT_578476, partial [Lipomyces mesembrius]
MSRSPMTESASLNEPVSTEQWHNTLLPTQEKPRKEAPPEKRYLTASYATVYAAASSARPTPFVAPEADSRRAGAFCVIEDVEIAGNPPGRLEKNNLKD